jgi:uncharacterized protein YggE
MNVKDMNVNVVFGAAAILASAVFHALVPPPRLGEVSVAGECMKKVAKDRTAVVLEIKNLKKDSTAAVRASTETYNRISEYMLAVQSRVPGTELETTRMDTYDKTEWNQALKKNEKLGVESVIGLEISLADRALLGEILAEVSKNKDVYTNGLNMYASKELLKAGRDACLDEALKDARAKAETLARANGQEIGPMLSASSYQTVSGGGRTVEYKARVANMVMAEASMDSAAAPALFAGSAEISIGVNASFKLK